MTSVILTDTTTGAAAPSDDSLSVVEINTAVTNSGGNAFDFDGFDNSTLIVAGIVASQAFSSGVFGNGASSESEVVVSASGIVSSGDQGIWLQGERSSVTNEGLIEGTSSGLSIDGDEFVLRNTGTIVANSDYDLSSASISRGVSLVTIGQAQITNTGMIASGYFGIQISGDDENAQFDISNSGLIEGWESAIHHISGDLSLDNSGDLLSISDSTLFHSLGDLDLVNSGRISMSGSGSYAALELLSSNRSDSVQNSGEIVSVSGFGIVSAGANLIVQNSGLISASFSGIFLEDLAGNSFQLTNSGEIVSARGLDAIAIAAGSTFATLIVNTGQISGAMALGDGQDIVVTTGEGLITGAVSTKGGADYVQGGQFTDQVNGGSGIDILLGGGGADVITGGDDIDFLLGEEGADVFLFTAISDSAAGEADSILDFEQGEDIIDLYSIETSIAFLGTGAFTGSGGAELRTTNVGGVLSIVNFDVNGDGLSDLEIVVYGALDMSRADFGL